MRAHDELALIGDGLFNVAFRANPAYEPAIDIYHVNDSLAANGWRMNGLQLPPALHFCVTRPNTQAGVAEAFAADLATAVEYAKSPDQPMPRERVDVRRRRRHPRPRPHRLADARLPRRHPRGRPGLNVASPPGAAIRRSVRT